MSELIQELARRTRLMQTERPADCASLRRRMGAKKQNASIQRYAYIDLRSTMDVLYQIENNLRAGANDFASLKKTALDWLRFTGGRAPVCFNLHEFSGYALRAAAELESENDRNKAAALIRAMQHYTCELSHWLDLEFPWAAVAEAYAKAMGDPPPEI